MQFLSSNILSQNINKNIIITEKICAHRVWFQKKNHYIYFYNKKLDRHIELLDRIQTDLWDDFINYILHYKNDLPNGKYFLYYFNKFNVNSNVEYDNIPKSKLILTNVSNGIDINKVSKILNIDISYPIYDGVLTENIYNKINEYLNFDININDIFIELFGKSSNFIKSNSNIINGFVFNIDNKRYILNDKRFKYKDYDKVNTDSYKLLVLHIIDYLTDYNQHILDLYINDYDDKISILYKIFKNFVRYCKKNNILDDILVLPPDYLKKNGIINDKLIKDADILDILKDEQLRYLLYIFINIFKGAIKSNDIISEDKVIMIKNFLNKIK